MEFLRSIAEYRLRDGLPPGSANPASATHSDTVERTEEGIRCRVCGRVVTGDEQCIAVNGSHQHTFFNPAGIVYELGCFRHAPGCDAVGPFSSEFTWFPGHLWQIALCQSCQTHLGWFFSQGGEGFFGLILPRLQS